MLFTQFATDIVNNLDTQPVSQGFDPWVGVSFVITLVFGFGILALIVAEIMGMWKMYTKAGRPGWAILIPFYNSWVLAEIGGKPGWWGLVPLVAFFPIIGWIAAIVITIMIVLGVARNFGKSDAFAIFGLWLFAPIGMMILGFGSAKYQGVIQPGMPTGGQPTVPTVPTAPMPTPPSPMQ